MKPQLSFKKTNLAETQ